MEQVLKEKLELLIGFDDEITQLCKIDDIEQEIELADEIQFNFNSIYLPLTKKYNINTL